MTELNTPGRVRRAIREKVQAILKGRTPAGDSVFVSRAIPSDTEYLPVVLIYTTGERVNDFDESPKRYRREMSLLIECIVAGDDDEDLDDKIEILADAVEALIEDDDQLGMKEVNGTVLSATEFTQDAKSASPVGRLALQYTVTYFIEAIAEKTFDDFKGADVDWRIKRPEQTPTTVDAENTINVNQ